MKFAITGLRLQSRIPITCCCPKLSAKLSVDMRTTAPTAYFMLAWSVRQETVSSAPERRLAATHPRVRGSQGYSRIPNFGARGCDRAHTEVTANRTAWSTDKTQSNVVSNLKPGLYKDEELDRDMLPIFFLAAYGFNHGIFGTTTGLNDPNSKRTRQFLVRDAGAYLDQSSHANYDDSLSDFNIDNSSSMSSDTDKD